MQSLPVTATQSAASAPAPAPADGTAQAAEPFGSVLARQRANADAPGDGKQLQLDHKQPAAPSSKDVPATVASNDPAIEQQAPAPDMIAALPVDLLTVSPPVTAAKDSRTSDEKTIPQAPVPDGSGVVPAAMLALLLSPTATTVNGKDHHESIPDGGKKTRAQAIATAALDEIWPSAKNKTASVVPRASVTPGVSVVPGVSVAPGAPAAPRVSVAPGAPAAPGISASAALLLAQGSAKPEVADINAAKDKVNTFAAALKISSKENASAAELGADATKTHMQPVAPPALDSLMQNGGAAIAASQNGATQAVQTTINTPVTHQAWGDEFSQKITWMSGQHEQTAALHLNPPNLGPLDVVLSISGDQATALFTSSHAAVRDAVEQALPQLRSMMADNGITLGNATVSDQSPRDQPAWQARQQQNGNGGASGEAGSALSAGDISSGAAVFSGRRQLGMVDTFA